MVSMPVEIGTGMVVANRLLVASSTIKFLQKYNLDPLNGMHIC